MYFPTTSKNLYEQAFNLQYKLERAVSGAIIADSDLATVRRLATIRDRATARSQRRKGK